MPFITKHPIDIYVYYTVPINLCDTYQPTILKLLSKVAQICQIETDLQQRIEMNHSLQQMTWLEIYKKVVKIEAWKEAMIKASCDIDHSLIDKIRHHAHEEYFYSIQKINT